MSSWFGYLVWLLCVLAIAMQHNALNLLDLPLPWLSQMALKQLDNKSKQSLFSTCTAFRDLFLEQADDVQCQIRNALLAARAASSLQLITRCKAGANVKLLLKEVLAKPANNLTSSSFTNWLRILCSRASITPGLPLHRVTCVELQGHVLGDIVPLELAVSCPNMTHLIRWGRFYIPQGYEYAPLACHQLQKLTIHHLSHPTVQSNYNPLSAEELKLQLQTLPNLQHVECTIMDNSVTGFTYLASGLQVLSEQLVSLCWHSGPGHGLLLSGLLDRALSQLCVLRAPRYKMSDIAELHLLLQQAPFLDYLELGGIPPCTNTMQHPSHCLRILKVADATVSNFAGLPVSRLHEFRFGQLTPTVENEQDNLMAVAVLSNTTTRVVTDRTDGAFAIYIPSEAGHVPAGLASLISLIPHTSLMFSRSKRMDDEWLQLLADLDCKHLMVAPQALPSTCWGMLLQKLPQLHTVELLYLASNKPKAGTLGLRLCTLLTAPPRPFTLRAHAQLGTCLGSDLRTWLGTFLQACDHGRVTLDIVDSK